MLFVLTIVAPVFGVIAIGYACGRTGWLSEAARKGMSEFAFAVAIPALLFHRLATADFPTAPPLGLWISFFGAALLTGLIGFVLARWGLGRKSPEGVAIGMSAMYANAVMLGIPISIARFGDEALVPLALIILLQPPLMWLTGLSAMGIADNDIQKTPYELAVDLANELGRNPIVISTLLGAIWGWTGLGLFAPLEKLLGLLAQAGVPAALVALGLTLTQFEVKGQLPTLTVICLLKLIAMPLIAWGLAAGVFGLSTVETGVVVLVAAMPTGATAFLFANRFGYAVNSASGAVALGTVLAAVTVSVFLVLL